MPQTQQDLPARATLRKSDGTTIEIQFNPVSLQNTVSNTLSQQGQGQRTQYVSQSSAKLTMDLIFDSTDVGTDVRLKTAPIAELMKPGGAEGDQRRDPPEAVEFSWGTFTFSGVLESFRETIDFFAPEGIPLRSSVNITLTKQSNVFDRDPAMRSRQHQADPLVVPLASGADVTSVASAAGDPNAWRALASANGIENPRAQGGSIAVDASLSGGLSVSVGGAVSATLGEGTRFDVGGRAQASASGLSVNVGNERSLRDTLQFEG